jgi:hypothetical protein
MFLPCLSSCLYYDPIAPLKKFKRELDCQLMVHFVPNIHFYDESVLAEEDVSFYELLSEAGFVLV